MTLEDSLQRYFGFSSFRGNQKSIVKAIVAGKDLLTLMSTGGGKSLCYQLPAVLLPGVTIVISPLISLMEDQVSHLLRKNILATWITHLLPPDETQYRLELLTIQHYKLLYVSPERLQDDSFCAILQTIPISLVVIDEAHCISEWGHEFRPEYRQIQSFLSRFKQRPIISAFTATATLSVAKDIIEQLSLQQPYIFHSSVTRSNLSLAVVHCYKQHEKWLHLLRILTRHQNSNGIIYTTTRANTQALATKLQQLATSQTKFRSLQVGFYHAGMSDTERHQCQKKFQSGAFNLLCATTAFGMGIDKADIRFVIHTEHPNCLESYYQQVGRAGRDGLLSNAYVLFHDQDYLVHWQMLRQLHNQQNRERGLKRLQQLIDYCQSRQCRMQQVTAYFGEETEPCQMCDICTGDRTRHPYFQTPLVTQELDTIRRYRWKSLTDFQTVSAACLQPKSTSDWQFVPGCGRGWRNIWQT